MATVKGFKIGNKTLLYQDPNLAVEFNEEVSYNKGEYVINPDDGRLYVFTSDHAAGSWVGTDAVIITVGDAINNITVEIETAQMAAKDVQMAVEDAQTAAGDAQTAAVGASGSALQANASAGQANTSASEASSYAVDSEAWAVGKRRRIPVVDDADETFRNNSKYYAELAGQLTAEAVSAAERAAAAAAAVQAIQEKTEQIDANTAAIEELMYNPIVISSFAISPASAATVEKGNTVNSVTLNYSLNRAPTGLTLDNVDVMNTLTTDKSGTIQLTELALKADKTYTLVASHSSGEGKPSSLGFKTAKISFLSKVYYGLVENPSNITSGIINELTHDVWENNVKRQYSFNNAGSTAKYVVFAIPHAKCGDIQFYDPANGWKFVVNTVKEDWTHENEYHEEVKYNVYVSDSKLSGGRNVTVEIK